MARCQFELILPVESKVNFAIRELISEWWNHWHRFTEDNEKPPEYIMVLISYIYDEDKLIFNYESGKWENA